jgi:hypothetical protein
MLSEVFWSFFITSSIGFILAFTKMLYKSKCKEISFCGLKIIRDTEAEEKIDELEIERRDFQSQSANADHQELKEEKV